MFEVTRIAFICTSEENSPKLRVVAAKAVMVFFF